MIKKKYLLYAVVILCFVGRGILFYFGYNMGALATSSITKIHPVTYLILFLFLTRAIYASGRLVKGSNSVLYYLLALISLIIYLFFTDNANAVAFIADALFMPALFYMYAKGMSVQLQGKLLNIALMMITINSVLAIIERALTIDFFPIDIEVSYGATFRSTAMLGHPLNNALITLIFILYVLVSDFKPSKKNMYIGLFFLALICFGARGCIAVAVIAIVLLYLAPLFFSRSKYFLRTNKTLAIFIMGFMSIALIYVVSSTTFGERLMNVSFFDSSADVRVQSLNLVDFNALGDFLWAKPQTKIDFMTSSAGIGTIENFIIVWILKFGFVFTVLLLGSLIYFLVASSAMRNKKIMLLLTFLFLIAALTNNSLATPTQALIVFVIVFSLPSEKYKYVF